MKKLALCLTGLAVVILAGAHSPAATIMDPPFDKAAAGLGPGDPYYLAFVTEGGHDAVSSQISVYNQFVTDEAERADAITEQFGIQWFGTASTETVDAYINAAVAPGVPVFRLDGVKVAAGFSDLWDGSINAPLEVSQFLPPPIPAQGLA